MPLYEYRLAWDTVTLSPGEPFLLRLYEATNGILGTTAVAISIEKLHDAAITEIGLNNVSSISMPAMHKPCELLLRMFTGGPGRNLSGNS